MSAVLVMGTVSMGMLASLLVVDFGLGPQNNPVASMSGTTICAGENRIMCP